MDEVSVSVTIPTPHRFLIDTSGFSFLFCPCLFDRNEQQTCGSSSGIN